MLVSQYSTRPEGNVANKKVNTNGNAATVNLPASPLVGDSVTLLDLHGVFGTYNLTVGRNGKQIQDADADLVLDVNTNEQYLYMRELYKAL